MTQLQINAKVYKDSGRGFQSNRKLFATYGLDAALLAMAHCEAMGRVRVYGREAGGIGPGR